MGHHDDMYTRPRWQSLLIAFVVVFGVILIPLLIVNRWLEMPGWGVAVFAAIVAGLVINKFFAHKIF